jgi:hypothetical protein
VKTQPEPYRKAGYYHGIYSPALYTEDQMKDKLMNYPKLPNPVGKVTRQHETPGHMVADGGRIISVGFLIVDDVSTLEDLYTTSQMKEYATQSLTANKETLKLALEALKYIRTSSLADEFVVQQAISEINKVLKEMK